MIYRFDYEEVEAELKTVKDIEETTKENAKKVWEANHPE